MSEDNFGDMMARSGAELAAAPPEAERIISENRYDCWEEKPLNTGTVVLRRRYVSRADTVRETLRNTDIPGTAFVLENEQSPSTTEAEFHIPLAAVALPERAFNVGYMRTFDNMIDQLNWYESVQGVDDGTRQERLDRFANSGFMRLYYAIEELKEHGSKAFEKVVPLAEMEAKIRKKVGMERFYTQYFGRIETMGIQEAFPEFKSVSELMEEVREKVGAEAHSLGGDVEKEVIQMLESGNLGDTRVDRGAAMTPNPALYYDTWFDSRFYDGHTPGGLAIGNIPVMEATGDLDASAALELIREGRGRLNTTVIKSDEWETLYTPPNLTNLFLIGVPVLPAALGEAEKKLHPDTPIGSKFSDEVVIAICETPERINPVTFSRKMDERFGAGRWILAKNDPETHRMVQVVQKPKEEWKITSTRRKNTVLPGTGVELPWEERVR